MAFMPESIEVHQRLTTRAVEVAGREAGRQMGRLSEAHRCSQVERLTDYLVSERAVDVLRLIMMKDVWRIGDGPVNAMIEIDSARILSSNKQRDFWGSLANDASHWLIFPHTRRMEG